MEATEGKYVQSRSVRLRVPRDSIFGALMPTTRIRPDVELSLDGHAYLPKVDDPKYDWVASVAIPALRALSEKLKAQGRAVREFCTIGTGTGTDALAAVEILKPQKLVVTDIHSSVVENAVTNIRANLVKGDDVVVAGEVGDLCAPLLEAGYKFDLIYENLPNIPVSLDIDLLSAQNTSSFYRSADADTPEAVKNDLFELHYQFLKQARPLLKENGRVLCSIGCRRPLRAILNMVNMAEYEPEILIYTWKMQSEAEDVIGGYARQQRVRPETPFFFYRADTLERIFEHITPFVGAARAFEIEDELRLHALDAEKALESVGSGVAIGHTTTVIEARPK